MAQRAKWISTVIGTMGAAGLLIGSVAMAQDGGAWEQLLQNDGVASANPRYDLVPQPTRIAPGFRAAIVARGVATLENPAGLVDRYGFLDDYPPQPIEATKTEPDQNIYLVLDHNPGGPAAGFDYGRHFLFQGHEGGSDVATVTRVNLDVAPGAHRITLLTPPGADGKTHFNALDGGCFDPFTRTLLFTEESGSKGGVVEIGSDFSNAPATTLYGSLGHAGYEGIRVDDAGRVYLVEDSGGTSVNVVPTDPSSVKAAKLPNSFVYRFLPVDPTDLSQGGKLQVLQVALGGTPLVFVPIDATHPTGDVFSQAQLLLHRPGTSYPVRWLTVHDTAVDGTAEFDASALAKAQGGTPFKRPENVAFLPASDFRTFFFAPTGDTSADAGNQVDLALRGAWGSVFRVDLAADRETGTLSIVLLGDSEHAAFDNLTFATGSLLLVGEDRGDTLHKQLSRLDSVWALDVENPQHAPVRFVALGRDALATRDAHLLDTKVAGYQNEGDNEPTGIVVSDGDASIAGLLGAKVPDATFRTFFTQQHGANLTREVIGRFE